LTAALRGKITIKDGAVEQSNFDDYEMLRIADAPHVETVIVPSGGFWGGVGEPPVPPLAPALVQRHLRRHRQADPFPAAGGPRLQQGDLKRRRVLDARP